MTIDELSNEFDTQLNNLTNQEITFTEYDKSIYLTKAQEQIFKQLYSGGLAPGSFEKTEQNRRYVSGFEETRMIFPIEDYQFPLLGKGYKEAYKLPEDLAFITYEEVQTSTKEVPVIPITQDEFHRVKENPFRGPSKIRALRMDLTDKSVEIISIEPQVAYLVRYLRIPKPIILEDLPDGMTINELSTKSIKCELHTDLHRLLIDTAIEYALRSIKSDNNV